MNLPICNYCEIAGQVKPINFASIVNCPPIEQDHSSPFLQKIYKMGHGERFTSHEEAANWLLERDHKNISYLGKTHESLGGYFVPPYYFSACPRILEPENVTILEDLVKKYKSTPDTDTENKVAYLEQLKNLVKRKGRKSHTHKVDNIALDKCFNQLISALNGDISERKSFQSLKNYFDQNQEDALILHSHKFLIPPSQDSLEHLRNCTYNKEKDFIIINLTKGYIVVIDLKYSLHSKSIKKGLEQIESAKHSLKEILGIQASQWTFMGFVVGMKSNETVKVYNNLYNKSVSC